MTHKTALALFLAGLATLAATSAASAQTSDAKIFIDVNVGAQTQARTLTTSTSFPLYGETAIVNASEAVDGGGLFDVSGRVRVIPNVSAGVGVSIFSKKGDGTLAASIPNPNFLNRAANTTTSASDLKHREQAVHLMAAYSIPVSIVDVTIFAGPSFFTVKQDILSATVTAGTQTAVVATASEKASKTGANAGVNISYMVTPNYGVGVFARYAGATVELPSAGSVKVGGVQLGIGARLRF